jgi:hypothetical protein
MGGLALFISLGGVGYAANGGNFILGQANSATNQTSLSSNNAAAPTLNLVNTGGRPAARFQANGGIAPFTVSNSTKIANLNADKLDGLDSSVFARTAHFAAVSTTGGCNADSGIPTSCVAANITLARPGKLLLNATGAWHVFNLDDTIGANAGSDDPTRVIGVCNLVVDGAAVGLPQNMGEDHPSPGAPTHPVQSDGTMALTGLSGNLAVGLHTVEVTCTETDGDIDWGVNLTAALVDDNSAPGAAVTKAPKTVGAPDKAYPGKK